MFTGKRILVVEDIKKTLRYTLNKIERENATVDLANNVRSALAFLGKNKYDAIILDWRLPETEGGALNDTGGFLVLEAIKKESKYIANKNVPFIVVTAEKGVVDTSILLLNGNYKGCVMKLYPDQIFIKLKDILV